MAALCDEGKSFHPKSCTCDLWDCKVRIDFPAVKLRGYNQRWDELEASANPFATVVMAHLKARPPGRSRRSPENRRETIVHQEHASGKLGGQLPWL